VLGLATGRALHENRRIRRASKFLTPRHAQDLSALRLLALGGLDLRPQRGGIVRIVPPVAPADAAAGRERQRRVEGERSTRLAPCAGTRGALVVRVYGEDGAGCGIDRHVVPSDIDIEDEHATGVLQIDLADGA
jgi:hypothetical protein